VSFAITIRDRRRVIITAAALFVAALEAAAILHQLRKPPVMASGPVPVTALAPSPPVPQHINLSVERNGQSLRLRWDRKSAAVLDATHATLHIEDGVHQNQFDLNSALLRSGVLSYWPETRNVAFRLELFAPGRTVTESIRAVNGTAAEPPADGTRTQPRRHSSVEGHADRSEVDQTHPSPFAPSIRSARVGRAAPTSTAAPDNTAKEPPLSPNPPGVRDVVVPLPLPAPEPGATEVAEPARGSGWSRFAGKIPLLRKLVKHPRATPDPSE
jgi:hypothetical protein